LLIATICITGRAWAGEQATDKPDRSGLSWKLYTNARFGFSVRHPQDWRLGEPMPDGSGVTLYPPVPQSQVALSGFLNLVEGTSRDGRQTLEEFAAAHRRIITDLYAKKNIALQWQKEQEVSLGGFPAKQLSFSYTNEAKTKVVEIHIFSLGRNEGRGVRVKFPAASRTTLMPVIAEMLESYHPGRGQDNVSPFVPKSGNTQ
jgi:hypothetical protein